MADVVTAPDALQPAELNFEALHSKAMAFEPAASASPDSSAAPAPVPAPVADSTPAAPSLNPAEQKILDLPDDGMVRVKVDGKEELLPINEFKSGISREAHYTQRMQQLAEQRKQAEAELAAYYAQVQQQAQAVELAQQQLQQWVQQGTQPAPEAPKPFDPGELATVGDVQSYVQQLDANLRQHYESREQQLMQTLSQATQQAQEQAAVQRDALTYTQGLKQVLNHPDYKLLTDIVPYAEESIRFQVAQMDPPTIEDAVRYTEQVAREWHQKLQQVALEQQKRQQVAEARAKLEPPAGSPPSPQVTQRAGSFFRKDGKLDWEALRTRADAMMG